MNDENSRTDVELLNDLVDWAPEDEHITSAEEAEMLKKHFGMKERSILSLRNLRNTTVLYLPEKAQFVTMLSITAVIDQELAMRGVEI